MRKKTMPKTYRGKSTAPGMGGAFSMMEDAMMAKGMPKDRADAVAAAAGRKKYGKAAFQKMAVAGRKRAAAKKAKK